jgi:hypothetical protein
LQLENNNIGEEKNNKNTPSEEAAGFQSVFENFIKQLTELNNLTTLGPFTSLMNDPNLNLNTLKEHGNLLLRYHSFLNLYFSRMINAYLLAVNKVSSTIDKKNPDEIRKIIINTFEDVFSSMLQSTDFSINYNNLLNSSIDVTKSYQKIYDSNAVLFKSQQQQLSKEEKDLLFYNLYEIKKISLEIKKKLNERKNE